MAGMWNSQGGNVWQLNASPLELLIARATSAHLPEPNYQLHLEVAEYVNSKKANKYVSIHGAISWRTDLYTLAHETLQWPSFAW